MLRNSIQSYNGHIKKAQKNNKKESECHKKYYDQKMRCMKLKPDDLVMV